MIKINIVAVGKVKEKYFSQAIEEYSKRLSRFCKLEIIEVKEENFVAEPNNAQIEIIKQKEGESYGGSAAYNGHHAAGQHPVDILGGSHGNHHRHIHLLPKVHTLNKILLFGKGE